MFWPFGAPAVSQTSRTMLSEPRQRGVSPWPLAQSAFPCRNTSCGFCNASLAHGSSAGRLAPSTISSTAIWTQASVRTLSRMYHLHPVITRPQSALEAGRFPAVASPSAQRPSTCSCSTRASSCSGRAQWLPAPSRAQATRMRHVRSNQVPSAPTLRTTEPPSHPFSSLD